MYKSSAATRRDETSRHRVARPCVRSPQASFDFALHTLHILRFFLRVVLFLLLFFSRHFLLLLAQLAGAFYT